MLKHATTVTGNNKCTVNVNLRCMHFRFRHVVGMTLKTSYENTNATILEFYGQMVSRRNKVSS
jgi:hypothetical protein